MGKPIKFKGLYMVLSVLIALLLWSYVGNVGNPEETDTIRNLPVTFTGLDALEARGLMISSGAEQTVSLRVTGRRKAVRSLSAETVNILVNVANITQAGEHTLAYQVTYNLPGDVSDNSLVILERYPNNVTFTISRLAKREIPIRGTVTGSVAEGYQAGKFSFLPETIEVWGEESIVNQIEYAQVTLDEENMTETYTGDLPYTFITFVDEPLDPVAAKSLVTDVSLVQTTLPIVKLKEVELMVNLIPGGGATSANVKCTISPPSIIVSGSPNDLEPLKSISLGDIDLGKLTGNTTLTYPIPLAAELTNVSGISEAVVTLELTGLVTATIETENIQLINPIEGYTAEAVTQVCQVMVRGSGAALATVTPSQVLVVADLSNAVATSGTQTIPVKVLVNSSSNVGVVGEYSIVVSITKE